MADLVENLFDGAIKRAFPEATPLDLWGAGIIIYADGQIVATCGGKTVILELKQAQE